jgi:hypothetical protein
MLELSCTEGYHGRECCIQTFVCTVPRYDFFRERFDCRILWNNTFFLEEAARYVTIKYLDRMKWAYQYRR